jgi:biotin carboxylase
MAPVARVLIVLTSSSYRVADFVDAAGSLGVELAIAGDAEPPLGMSDRFVAVDCDDPEGSAQAIADLAASTPVDAIVAADDQGVEMAARAAELIGLPQNRAEAAAATRDKALLRAALDRAEVPQPVFELLEDDADPAAVAGRVGFPVVVKPRTLSGSRGVIRADDPAGVVTAADRVRGIRRAAGAADLPLLVERFVPGPEVSVEGMLWDGELEVLAIFDKPDPLDGPFFEETMFVTPTRLPPATARGVVDLVRRAVAAIGLAHGPVHAEVRIGPEGPVLIEVAARSIGGLCGRALRFGLMGTALEVMILRQALGMRKESLRRERRPVGVLMVPIPGAGTLRATTGGEEAAAVPGVTAIEWSIPLGSHVEPVPEGDRYLGFVFARADSAEAVEEALREAGSRLKIQID